MTDNYKMYNDQYQYMRQIIEGITTYSRIQTTGRTAGTNFQQYIDTAEKNLEVPESMDCIFEEAANKYDVPLNLLKAMAKAESGFDEKAVSSAGAQGVMQLMPATAKSLGVEDPFDARSNIMGGAKYISDKLKQYDGDIDLALAAYNAGSGNVKKYGGVPPFKETQNYIRRIKEYMGMDLSTDKTVTSKQSGIYQSGTYAGTAVSAAETGFDLDTALYMIEMMRLRLYRTI